MKKLLAIIGMLVLLIPAVSGAMGNASSTARVLIRADDPAQEVALRNMLDVRHDFGRLGFTAEVDEDMVPVLASMDGVHVEEVGGVRLNARDNGGLLKRPPQPPAGRYYYPSDQTPWGIEMMYNDPGVSSTGGGAGVDVAVLDSGVYKDHLDLVNRVKQCKDFTGSKGVVNSCADKDGHGTHVAGTILADGGADGKGIYGMAPQANLWAYKVCGAVWCMNDDIAEAIRYAADNGAEIISMSLGSNSDSSLIRDAIDYASGKDCLIVAAAGNDGPGYGSIDYPGANVKVIAVGAIDSGKSVPDWSSRGINDGDYVIEEREVEFAAPGVSVESTYKNGGYYFMSGTSMATPHVSGLAAKYWQGSGASTRTFLQGLAHDIWTSGDDTATGFGLPTVP